MMQKLTKFFNLIKENKQARILSVMTIAMLFIFTIGYSLSVFTNSSNKKVANIKVNDLSFNITTNSGELDDRILHLKAGKTELFKITITNLNKIDTKYELIYKVCTDVKCTSYLDTLPNEVKLGLNISLSSKVNGILTVSSSTEVNILTENNSSTDYYILLDLQAGYSWNDLALLNQFNYFSKYVSIIAYVDGEEVAEYPDSCDYTAEIIGYKNNKQITLEESEGICTNNKWKISYVGMPDKIQIKFKKKIYPTLLDYLASLDKTSNGLEVDDTDDQNLRYVGATPKNYILFNDEIWRIIGTFNVYNNDSNKNEKLIKIIRNVSLGNYSWDTSDSSINSGYGVNEWSQADLMTELNNDYLDASKTSGTTTWYNGNNNAKSGSYDYSKNIKSGYIDKIANVRWNLGAAVYQGSAKNNYIAERGTTYISNPADGVTRKNTWDGKVGLMYPSDYGYASIDTDCRNNLASNVNSVYSCKNNNWLFNIGNQWTLSPYSGYARSVFDVDPGGNVSRSNAANAFEVRPVLFLKYETKITGGTGTESDPYQIGTMSNFANDSWSTIAENVKNGNSSIYKVGDEKEVEIGGNSYTVRVANNSTPSECKGANFSQTACGFVVEFVDIVETRAMNSSATNVGGWPATAMRTYANGEFFNKLPSDLKKVIVDTTVISGHGSTSGENNFTSTDKIYLLSAKEVWGNSSSLDSAINNTRQLDYYSSKGITTFNYSGVIKQYNDSNAIWWLRSSRSDISSYFHAVFSTGSFDSHTASGRFGFSPAFRIG